MNRVHQFAGIGALALFVTGTFGAANAAAQTPITTVAPIIVDTAVPIIVNEIKPQPKATGLVKFEGSVMNANRAQVTVRSFGNDLSIQTFPLSEKASEKMQQIVDKGGYQHGDRIIVYYDPRNLKVIKFKGKPSPPL
ncbi:MAG TPA: hypothetical protein VN830_10765 [Verrucomicrobiae bacterium]|nr:hypothetical protein [Verrucomicrobiae bacterium]